MRPTSQYLHSMRYDTPACRLNLAGSSPPFVGRKDFFNDIVMPLAREDVEAVTLRLQGELGQKYLCAADEFRFAPGTSSVYTLALAAVTEIGDRVLIEQPTYDPFPICAEFLHLKVENFDRSYDSTKDLKELKAKSKKSRILVLSNPNCPLGRVSAPAEIREYCKLFKWVIVDEVFLPMFADGKITLFSGDIPKNLIVISGLSKSLGLGVLRLGWIRAHSKALQSFDRVALNFHIEPPAYILAAGEKALLHWQSLISPNLHATASVRKILNESFMRISAADGIDNLVSHDMKHGHFVTLRVPKKFRGGDEFALQVLKDHGIWLRPAKLFWMPKHVRVNFFMTDAEARDLGKILEGYYI